MKRFGIIGAGRFGVALAESLAANGAEVILLDRDREAVQAFAQTPIKAIQGDAGNLRTLRDAGFESCEAVVIAIGDHMEGSVLATVNCKELGISTVVAKAATDLHGKVLERVGADVVVHPNRDRAIRLARSLLSRTPIDLFEIADGYSVAEVAAPKALQGKTLIEGGVRQKYGVTVLAIRRQSEDPRAPRRTLIANGTETIEEKDILVVFGPDGSLDELRDA
jgi:trk system potassium uptake protein TrkA